MALELTAAAQLHRLPSSVLAEVAPGVWSVMAAGEPAPIATAFVLEVAPRLACVRAVLRLHGSSAHGSTASLAAAVPGLLIESKEPPTWSLGLELRERPTELSRLPLRLCPGAEIALGVAAAVAANAPGSHYCTPGDKEDGSGARMLRLQHRSLVVVEVDAGAMLLCERLCVGDMRSKPRPFGGGSEERAAAWHRLWAARPFLFSACLDSWVGACVLSLALMAWRTLGSGKELPHLLDACCGSGTLAAVATASDLFGTVAAVEVDASFAARVPANFEHVGLTPAPAVLVQDATKPFSEAQCTCAPDIVVCNPPWGWRLKVPKQASGDIPGGSLSGEGVAARIITNLLGHFPQAILAVVCPTLPAEAALHAAGFAVRWSCALGQSAVWVLAPYGGVGAQVQGDVRLADPQAWQP